MASLQISLCKTAHCPEPGLSCCAVPQSGSHDDAPLGQMKRLDADTNERHFPVRAQAQQKLGS